MHEQETPPVPLPVLPERIPAELKEIPQWVAWEYVLRKDKWTKPPLDPKTGHHASATNASTWVSFGRALRWSRIERLPGIGFVLTPEAGIVAIDLDHCVEAGVPTDEAAALVAQACSYAEYSPSGAGLRILLRGQLPCKGTRHGPIEVYMAERYVTITGHALPGSPDTLIQDTGVLAMLLDQIGWQPAKPEAPRPVSIAMPPTRLDDLAIRRATRALLDSTGPAQYSSASEADSAIACALVGAGLSEDAALALILASTRGADAAVRKGARRADAYWRHTIAHAASFVTPRVQSTSWGFRTDAPHSASAVGQVLQNPAKMGILS